jgi:hypothetical protein
MPSKRLLLLATFFLILLSHSSFGQDIKPVDFIDGIILVDSNYVAVEKDGQTIAKLKAGDKKYFEGHVRYDRTTGFVSAIRCSSTTNINHWRYEAIVWDYLNEKTWVITQGDSYYGEGAKSPLVFRYDPSSHSGIIMYYGWEWSWITVFADASEEAIKGFRRDFGSVLGLLPENRMIIQGGDYGEDTEDHFYIYDWKKKILMEVSFADLQKYRSAILRDSGVNVAFESSQPYYPEEGQWLAIISWNPPGTAFVYTKYTPHNKMRRNLMLHDYQSTTEVLIGAKHIGYAVMWR